MSQYQQNRTWTRPDTLAPIRNLDNDALATGIRNTRAGLAICMSELAQLEWELTDVDAGVAEGDITEREARNARDEINGLIHGKRGRIARYQDDLNNLLTVARERGIETGE